MDNLAAADDYPISCGYKLSVSIPNSRRSSITGSLLTPASKGARKLQVNVDPNDLPTIELPSSRELFNSFGLHFVDSEPLSISHASKAEHIENIRIKVNFASPSMSSFAFTFFPHLYSINILNALKRQIFCFLEVQLYRPNSANTAEASIACNGVQINSDQQINTLFSNAWKNKLIRQENQSAIDLLERTAAEIEPDIELLVDISARLVSPPKLKSTHSAFAKEPKQRFNFKNDRNSPYSSADSSGSNILSPLTTLSARVGTPSKSQGTSLLSSQSTPASFSRKCSSATNSNISSAANSQTASPRLHRSSSSKPGLLSNAVKLLLGYSQECSQKTQ
jgi:hypothetical protein